MSLTLSRMADKLYKLLSVCYTNVRPQTSIVIGTKYVPTSYFPISISGVQNFLSFKITPQDHNFY